MAKEKKGNYLGFLSCLGELKELGVTTLEFMPLYDFEEVMYDPAQIAAASARHPMQEIEWEPAKINYWGYGPAAYFAPKASYFGGRAAAYHMKETVDAIHSQGMECIMEMSFVEGTSQDLMVDALIWWVREYRVDGFRFDLASILGRNEDGSPMENPPLVKNLAYDSLLADTKLIAEAWDAGGLYQVGSFPAFRRWSEWNGRYRDDVREYLKGGLWAAGAALQRIAGSPDIYDTRIRGKHASVNFLTCHDGFTLYDLYSYNQKHNEANGWGNLDGSDDNRSWNCGAEGDTDQVMVVELRHRMMKNAFAVLLCSRGTPMFLAGDEFGNTQFGNNNAYCQDNEISWLDWTRKEKFQDVFDFCAYMTAFRKRHPSITGDAGASSLGFPEISFHGEVPWKLDFSRPEIRTAAVMFAGYDNKMAKEDCVYLLMNPYWEDVWVELPQLPGGYSWHVAANTGDKKQEIYQNPVRISEERILVGPRSVIVLEADQQ